MTSLSCRKISNNIYTHFPLLNCGPCIVTSFQRMQNEKEKGKVTLRWRNLTDATSARGSVLTVKSLMGTMYPWYDIMRTALYLCGFLPQNSSSQSDLEKNINKFSLRDILRNNWHLLLKHFTGVKNKKILINCQPRVAQGDSQWNVMWHHSWEQKKNIR